MKPIKWNIEEYSVGDKTLDDQHLEIVTMINELSSQSDLGVHSETLHDALYAMLKYARNHLDDE